MSSRRLTSCLTLLVPLLSFPGCGDDNEPVDPVEEKPPGALIGVTLDSEVGVLLDELPPSIRERAAADLLKKPKDFWEERARAQILLTTYKLVYRDFYYDEEEGKGQLPLPPAELWRVEVGSPERKMVGDHDLVTVEYTLDTTLLTSAESAPESDPAFAEVGGTAEEPFVLPLDPELLLQRTGYACMDEEEFPPNSVDGENVATFYDDACEGAETDEGCHITEAPAESCVEALELGVGSKEVLLKFERLPWDPALANSVRLGEVTNTTGAELAVVSKGLENNRVIYRYIEPDSCAVQEGCVGGSGWRRLLQFDASVRNQGAAALHIGDVDYYLEDLDTPLANRNIFVYSDCHEHYHFSHYGNFEFESGGQALGNKQAFCLQSTNRFSNNEDAPLTHPYGACNFQGIQAGWGDDYGAGIDCQWIDVTNVEVPGASVNGALSFDVNPDRFLCEGNPVLDEDGVQTFEPSEFETTGGETVDRPVCEFKTDWDQNNTAIKSVSLPKVGGLINAACTRGQLGPRRDCGFTAGIAEAETLPCEAGEALTLRCSLAQGDNPMVLRACDYSERLKAGVACVYRDALLNTVLEGDEVEVTVDCPSKKSATEPGGKVSLYQAPVLPDDEAGSVTCSVVD